MSKLLTSLAAIGLFSLIALPAPADAAPRRADGIHRTQADTYEFSAHRRQWRPRYRAYRAYRRGRPHPYYYTYRRYPHYYYRPYYYYRPAPFPFFPFFSPW